jgi:hypothetical protein
MFYFSIHNLLHLWLGAGFPFPVFFSGWVGGGGGIRTFCRRRGIGLWN